MKDNLYLLLTVILIKCVLCQESTTDNNVSTSEPPKVFVEYNEGYELGFLLLFWIYLILSLLLANMIGLLAFAIFDQVRDNKRKIVKKPETVPMTQTGTNSPNLKFSKDETTIDEKSKEIVKKEEVEKKLEIMKKYSVEEWTPVPGDFRIEEKEMNPITITTHTVVASDIFVVHKAEPDVAIRNVRISDEIFVYPIGNDVDVLEATDGTQEGSSSHGGSSIMTASIRELQRKY